MNNQTAILLQLKQQGAQTAQQIAQQLNMTSMGARKHLLKLREAGLVADESQAQKAGRPSQYWQLTAAGHREFPDRHGELTLQMIDAVSQVFGNEGLERLIQQREQASLDAYRQAMAAGDSLTQKVSKLARIRQAEGYMAVCEQDRDDPSTVWLHENHCPICDAAKHCLNFCRSELSLFQNVLGPGVAVERVDHILTGARRCSYRIRQLQSSTDC